MSTASAFSIDVVEQDLLAPQISDSVPQYPTWRDGTTFGNQATRVTPIATGNVWLSTAFKRLAELSHLQADWDSYDADPPAANSIELARHVFQSLSENDLEPTGIDPSAEGGICISFGDGDRYADFECFNSGELLAVTSRGGDETDVWAVSDVDQDLGDALDKLREFLDR